MKLAGRVCGGGLVSAAAVLAVVLGLCILEVRAAEPAQSGSDTGVMVDPNKVPVASPAPAPAQMSGAQRPMPPRARPFQSPGAPPAAAPASQPVLTGPPPAVKVDEMTYDFGKLMGAETITHTFKLRNVGEGTLTIEGVQPQCGCTTTGAWAKTVAPGATWELPISLRTAGTEGKVLKTITVRTNDPKMREFRYTITGEIKSRYAFKPMRQFQLGRCQRDTVTKSKVTITNQTETPITLKKATVDNKSFEVRLREITAGKEYEVEVSTVPPLNEGFTQSKVAIETDCKEEPRFDMWVYAQVPPRLTLTPTMVAVPTPVEQDAKRSLTLRNEGATPVHVKEVVVSDPSIRSEVVATEEGKIYQISLTVSKGASIPPTGSTVTVVTDDEKTPRFTAQVRSYPSRPATTGPAYRMPTTRPAGAPTAWRAPMAPAQRAPMPMARPAPTPKPPQGMGVK